MYFIPQGDDAFSFFFAYCMPVFFAKFLHAILTINLSCLFLFCTMSLRFSALYRMMLRLKPLSMVNIRSEFCDLFITFRDGDGIFVCLLYHIHKMVNIPKERMTFCPGKKCRKHTKHKVTQYRIIISISVCNKLSFRSVKRSGLVVYCSG